MKKSILRYSACILLAIIYGCGTDTHQSTEIEENPNPPTIVIMIENGRQYDIIEIYGCTYVANDYGGVTHLANCFNEHYKKHVK